jgi:diamine N-acetyltransferase
MPAITLHGEFVDLVPLRPAHAALTLRWRHSDRAVHLNRGAATVEQQAAWIVSRPASEYNFVIALKDGRAVGTVSLTGIDLQHRHGEPGRFLIGEEAAVRGVPAAVEAMKLLYGLCFDTLGLVRVHGNIAEANLAMMKWQKFLGMKEEGRWRRHFFIDGRFQDAVLFAMLDDEYRSTALPRMNALIAAARPRQPLPA